MQHLIYCKKCNHHTTVHHLEWTAIICQSCGAEIASQTYIDLLLEKIENRDLNLAHRDRLIDELESAPSKPCPDCNYEEWATQEDAKREVTND